MNSIKSGRAAAFFYCIYGAEVLEYKKETSVPGVPNVKKVTFACIAALFIALAFSCAPSAEDGESGVPPHEHVYSALTAVAPDCENGGYTVYRCPCGDEYAADPTGPLGHDYIRDISSTGCESGSEVYICSRCGRIRTVSGRTAGHDIADPVYALADADGGKALTACGTCRVCGEYVTRTVCTVGHGIIAEKTDTFPSVFGAGGAVDVRLNGDGTLTLIATPQQYYVFAGWSDGDMRPSRGFGGDGEVYALFCFESDLPVIRVTTADGEGVFSRERYSECTVTVTGAGEYDLNGCAASIRVRGNASSRYGDEDWIRKNKVHYRIKFDKRTQMLGLGGGAACKSWVLLRGDGCYLNETIPFYLFRSMSDEFCPDLAYAALVINGRYMGLYEVCDQIQIDKYRIDIPEQKDGENELATGYLMELENYPQTAAHCFRLNYDNVRLTDMYGVTYTAPAVNVSVKYDDMTKEQVEYLKKYLSNVYRIVYRAIFSNSYYKLNALCELVTAPEFKSAGECISNVLDLDAAAAMYIIEELAMEKDVGIGSFFMYADLTLERPLLTFCAPWDFSWAWGSDHGYYPEHFWVSAWQPADFISYAGNRSSTWFITLYKCEEFRELVKQKWRRLRSEGTFDSLLELIPRFSQTYTKDIEMERKRWGTGDPAKSAERLMEFLIRRAAWLDTQWGE